MPSVLNNTDRPEGNPTVVVSIGRNPMIVRGGSSPGARIVSTSPDIATPSRSNSILTFSPTSMFARIGVRSSMIVTSTPSTFFSTSPGSRSSSAGLYCTHSVPASFATRQSRKSIITSPG